MEKAYNTVPYIYIYMRVRYSLDILLRNIISLDQDSNYGHICRKTEPKWFSHHNKKNY